MAEILVFQIFILMMG
jgi:hypothetical protein